MTSKKKAAANRRNARKSTGPKTSQGQAKASMNALRHGLRARTVILPDENREDFDEILAGLQDQYQPQSASEQHLVDQAAIAQWKLVRAEAYEARSCEKDPSIEACNDMFRKMTLVTGRLERAFFKAYKELERIKAAREKPAEQSKQSDESKGKKAKDDEPPAKLEVGWVNPKTGERDIWYRAEHGVPVKEFSDAPPDPAQSKPPNPPD
jgi:hypothetical protein